MNDSQGASPEQSGEAERRAEKIVRVLNGAARLEHGNSNEVHVDAATRVHADGRIENFVHMSATITARARVTATVTAAGRPQPVPPPPSLIVTVVAKGLADIEAEQALRIFGRDDVDYRDLYYVFEKADEALGGDMFADGTVTQVEVRRLQAHRAESDGTRR